MFNNKIYFKSFALLLGQAGIRHNNTQSDYGQHILNNRQECGPINNTMSLLKHINKTTMLLLYEQLYIQTHQHHK